jgi:hypothetical protein
MTPALPRLHLLELEDLPWFPRSLRDLMTDALSAMQRECRMHRTMSRVLHETLRELDAHRLVDLCSGAGGVLPELRRSLAEHGWPVHVLFTDRYPNRAALSAACRKDPEHLAFCADSLDAADMPRELRGFRTLFTSFHHFRPAQARAILRNAQEAQAGIAVFEITERSLIAFFRNALTPLACWAVTPRIRPRSAKRFFWTYVIPVVPLALTWDGFVSNLRTYTPEELRQLVAPLETADYAWRTGQRSGAFGQRTTFLVGVPQAGAAARVLNTTVSNPATKENAHVVL